MVSWIAIVVSLSSEEAFMMDLPFASLLMLSDLLGTLLKFLFDLFPGSELTVLLWYPSEMAVIGTVSLFCG